MPRLIEDTFRQQVGNVHPVVINRDERDVIRGARGEALLPATRRRRQISDHRR